MKKILISALTAALAIGATNGAFAAANPFSDVPDDHWSLKAVAKLAQEGVIEGYGDSTFQGDAHITRYEMAQMVARALAKSGDSSASDQALLDRLAAEYADELNQLGVRVATLEEKSDNLQITGLLELDVASLDVEGARSKEDSATAKLRLEVAAKVNDDWEVKGRFDGDSQLDDGGTSTFKLKRAYAHGTLFGGVDTKIGEFGAFDAARFTNGGLLIDTDVAGVEFEFGKVLQTKLTYSRLSGDDYAYTNQGSGYPYAGSGVNEYDAIQFTYDASDRLILGAGWHHIKNKNNSIFKDGGGRDDTNDIWTAGFDYRFHPDWVLGGLYAQSSVDAAPGVNNDNEASYSVQCTYKGARTETAGSYGVWAAYRQIGAYAAMQPTYNGAMYGAKGYELGVDYMVDRNVLLRIVYFDGAYLDAGETDVNKLFGRFEFTF